MSGEFPFVRLLLKNGLNSKLGVSRFPPSAWEFCIGNDYRNSPVVLRSDLVQAEKTLPHQKTLHARNLWSFKNWWERDYKEQLIVIFVILLVTLTLMLGRHCSSVDGEYFYLVYIIISSRWLLKMSWSNTYDSKNLGGSNPTRTQIQPTSFTAHQWQYTLTSSVPQIL